MTRFKAQIKVKLTPKKRHLNKTETLLRSPKVSFFSQKMDRFHCVKSVRIWNLSGPYFPAFRLNTEIYQVNLCIQSKCWKIRTRKTPNTDTFLAVFRYHYDTGTRNHSLKLYWSYFPIS